MKEELKELNELNEINMKVGKKYFINKKINGLRPDLQANGIVKCIEDKGDGFYIVKSNSKIEPNIWIIDTNNTGIYEEYKGK
ncbi:MAG: hypothetical protein PHY08_12815 [Candidatus Cloacimonetes bacterium]|nr:hypothetical protein [Candidatus Cloacimonadota bacterium]